MLFSSTWNIKPKKRLVVHEMWFNYHISWKCYLKRFLFYPLEAAVFLMLRVLPLWRARWVSVVQVCLISYSVSREYMLFYLYYILPRPLKSIALLLWHAMGGLTLTLALQVRWFCSSTAGIPNNRLELNVCIFLLLEFDSYGNELKSHGFLSPVP